MLRRVDKTDPMRLRLQKPTTTRHRGQDTPLAFLAQVLVDSAALSHQAHQALRLMRVQAINDEDPSSLGIGFYRLGDMPGEVRLLARRSYRGRDHATGGHFQVGKQTQSAVPDVLELAPFYQAGARRFTGVLALGGLDAGFFIGRDQMHPRLMQSAGLAVEGADRPCFFGKLRRVFNLWIEPVAAQVRFDLGFFLKSAPHCGAKSSRPCLV